MSGFVDQALRKATRHAKNGEFDLAEQKYRSVLEKFPKNERAAKGLKALLRSRASASPGPSHEQIHGLVELYHAGKLQEALREGRSLAKQFPAAPMIPNLLGAVYAQLGQLEHAIARYSQALQLKPDYPEALSNLGGALNDLGKPEQAIASLSKAVQLKPDFAIAHNNLGNALQGVGSLEKSISCFNQALQINPDYAEAHNNLGKVLIDLGRSAEAVASLTRAIQINPDFPAAHNNFGNALRDIGKPDQAVACFRRALELSPDIAEIHNNLGNVLSELGRSDEAIANFSKALELKPDFAGAHRNLSAVKQYQPNDRQTQHMLELIESDDLADVDRMHLSFAVAKALADIGDHDDAFGYLLDGNRLLKKQRAYNASHTQRLFTKIRTSFSAEVAALSIANDEKATPSPRPIFILGMPRSGTTLVEQIIASHSQVYGAGELRLLGQAVSDFNWDSTISSEQLSTIRQSYLRGLQNTDASHPYVTDKMPLNFRWIGFILSAIPEARVVHITRDPIAICYSNFKQYYPQKGHDFANDLRDVANYYQHYSRLMAFWQDRFPGRIYDLNYETLTRNQHEETSKLLAYLGLNWEDECLEFHNNNRAVQTASAVQVRHRMYQGSSEAWRNYEHHLAPMIQLLREPVETN